MNYIWEVMLKADQEGIDRDSLRFLPAVQPSPYIEVSYENLNTSGLEENKIEVNPLYRFSAVFEKIMDKNVKELKEIREIFMDVCLHYLAQLDLRSGREKQDYYMKFVMQDVENEAYGKFYKGALKLFSDKERKIWQLHLLRLFRTQNYKREFTQVVSSIYKGAILYEMNDRNNEILLYLGVRETEEERQRIRFLIHMFLPLQDNVILFYENHFGIIGVEETLFLDEMVLY